MSRLIDFLSVASIVGIWPRFYEPYRLKTTTIPWILKKDFQHLNGLKIVHITDLHFGPHLPQAFLDKIVKKVMRHTPDIIVFTGDFLCYSKLTNSPALEDFLNRLKAPEGCFAVFGNHDYARYVTRDKEGTFISMKERKAHDFLKVAWHSLSGNVSSSSKVSEEVTSIQMHSSLCALLKRTPFQWIENASIQLKKGLNITGLGELSLGRCHPSQAFKNYDSSLPGLVLTHNPDSIPQLLNYPGEWILCGHTHGEQIHFPYPSFLRKLSKKLTRISHTEYTRGLVRSDHKTLYINRGLGSTKPFRLFSSPEILLIKACCE